VTLRKHLRRVGGVVVTTLASLLVFLELVLPDQITRLPPGNPVVNALVRIPIEGLVALAVLLVLPWKPRQIVATVFGVLLGVLTMIKLVDIGFFLVLAREFDPANDWILFKDGYNYLGDSYGAWGAFGVAALAIVLTAGIITATTFSVRRLTRILTAKHTEHTRHTVFALSSAWLVLTVVGVQIVGGVPVASQAAAQLATDTVLKFPQDIQARKEFNREAAIDAYKNTPGDQLLTGLQGKDVILSFVESYGRGSLEDPAYNSAVLAGLKADEGKLQSKGFAAKTGFLHSPTFGGGSWYAHSTLLTGLWIPDQNRYESVVSSNRLSLTQTFKRAGYRTVAVEPGVTYKWQPEESFYGYNQLWDSHTLNYHGPSYSWSTMPDQFVMQRFEENEYSKPNRGPLLAEITLTSSHTPWNPVPKTIPWNQLGDGSVFNTQEGEDKTGDLGAKKAYAQSIAYSVDSLISFIQNYGKDNLVMVFLGDHEPAANVSGLNSSHDVPITIVAKDPKVLDKISSWGWSDGLIPAQNAPVWQMNQFRDKFLQAYGPDGAAH
jgi:hypothetical protein